MDPGSEYIHRRVEMMQDLSLVEHQVGSVDNTAAVTRETDVPDLEMREESGHNI
jgi:hypothetical protein